MSILHKEYEKQRLEKESIDELIKQQHIVPTEEELKLLPEVTVRISERFKKELTTHDIYEIREDIEKAIWEECDRLPLSYENKKRLEKIVIMTSLGLGPIDEYLQDDTITEIVVQRYDNIVIERDGKIEKAKAVFINEENLVNTIERIVQETGRQINLTYPIVDARLKDGSRVNATIPPVTPDGATLTIRKFNNKVLSGNDYKRLGSLTKEMLYFMAQCVKGKISIFVSGGTGSGKTTALNMLSSFIPDNELIVTIEDTLELKLQQPNVRRMEARLSNNSEMMQVDQEELVKNALRMRPDRIIMGEVRDGSIKELISAMSTGHEGSITTGHANSPRNLCDVRIPILYSMNRDSDFTEESIAMQIVSAINIIVQISRMPDGSRKITHISHVNGLRKDNRVNIKDIFVYDRKEEEFRYTGYFPSEIIGLIKAQGIEFDTSIFQKNKKTTEKKE